MASSSVEGSDITAKYQKLATEYSKVSASGRYRWVYIGLKAGLFLCFSSQIRAQAGVLKRAVLEEQNKSACLREQLRLKDANFRRLEQEVDSLGFRNKQLEHRVASLQDDLAQEMKKGHKGKGKSSASVPPPVPVEEEIIGKELQRKIFENAKLASAVEDRNTEIKMYAERLQEMEEFATRKSFEHADIERRMKKEIENLAAKNTELESRLVEAASTLGSEDGLSVTGSECHAVQASEERIAFLEKELNHWRTQFEVLRISQTLTSDNLLSARQNGPQTTNEDSFVAKT